MYVIANVRRKQTYNSYETPVLLIETAVYIDRETGIRYKIGYELRISVKSGM